MAIAHVANHGVNIPPTTDFVSNGTSVTHETFSPSNSANLLVCAMGIWHATDPAITSFTDAQTTWTRRLQTSTFANNGGFTRLEIWTAPATNTTSRTPQSNYASGSYAEGGIFEISGATSPTYQSGSNTGSNTATDANVSGVTASNDLDSIVVAAMTVIEDSNANITTPTPATFTQTYVEQDAITNVGFEMSYKIRTTSQTESASWTHDACTTTDKGWAAGVLVIGDGDADAGGSSVPPLAGRHLQNLMSN